MTRKAISSAPRTRRPRGLAARVSLLAAGGLALAGAICVAAVMYGFENESRRQQIRGAEEVADRVAHYSANPLLVGDIGAVVTDVRRMASRSEVATVGVYNRAARPVAAHGSVNTPELTRHDRLLAAVAIETGKPAHRQLGNGQWLVARPVIANGQVLGAAVVALRPEGFRYNSTLALTPFFLWLLCLALVGIPLIAHFVRRSLAPLEALTAFADKVAQQGVAAPITLRTGDEFETLANAFNQMIARLDASMRRIQQIAFVDPITQLPNHDRFQREADYFILQSSQSQELGAVLVIEFQRLPRLMQTLDPDASRELIRLIAERFTHAVRHVDRLVRLQQSGQRPALAARLGAHDFGVLVPALSSATDANRFAQHLNGALDQSFDWRGHKVSLGACCGVALAPRDGVDADAVIRHARMALAAAQTSPGRLKIFTPSIDRDAVAKLNMEREIRAALERNEFRAFFQPKIDLSTGRIQSAEALARWVRADKTIVSPGRFIPIAEESGLIEQLSNAILREACWKAAAWSRAGADVSVAVNVSALQFRTERFADQVLNIIKNSGLPPERLELEITETIAMEDPERALKVIEPLRAAGVRFAIDDFGCGHSSLSALSKLPFDVIKIDRQFVSALEHNDTQSAAIVEMILALAQTLGLKVVAEGVEKREQAAFLAARGCHFAQGFLYSAAVPAEDFMHMLRPGSASSAAAGEHAA